MTLVRQDRSIIREIITNIIVRTGVISCRTGDFSISLVQRDRWPWKLRSSPAREVLVLFQFPWIRLWNDKKQAFACRVFFPHHIYDLFLQRISYFHKLYVIVGKYISFRQGVFFSESHIFFLEKYQCKNIYCCKEPLSCLFLLTILFSSGMCVKQTFCKHQCRN